MFGANATIAIIIHAKHDIDSTTKQNNMKQRLKNIYILRYTAKLTTIV